MLGCPECFCSKLSDVTTMISYQHNVIFMSINSGRSLMYMFVSWVMLTSENDSFTKDKFIPSFDLLSLKIPRIACNSETTHRGQFEMSNGIKKLRIGVLEVQGAFLEHKNALNKATKELKDPFQIEVTEVRHSDHITEDLNGLIIPGGESTAISLFLKSNNMEEPLRTWIMNKNHTTWGTCAGMILLAKETEHQKQEGQISLNCMDTVVSRNYFGRQINSFEADMKIADPNLISKTNGDTDYFRGVFIRAPAILRTTSPDVKVLATLEENLESSVIVAARQGNVFCTSFHPELTEDTRWHRYFLQMILKQVV